MALTDFKSGIDEQAKVWPVELQELDVLLTKHEQQIETQLATLVSFAISLLHGATITIEFPAFKKGQQSPVNPSQ